MMEDQYPSVRSLLSVKMSSQEVFNQLFNQLVNTNGRTQEEIIRDINAEFDNIDKTLKEYEANISNDTERGHHDEFVAKWAKYRETYNDILDVSTSGNILEAYKMLGPATDVYNEAMEPLEANIDLNDQYLNEGSINIDILIKRTVNYVAIFFVVAIILAIIFAVVIIKHIMKATNNILDFTTKVAEGNLTEELIIENNDEFGIISDKINILVTSLRQMIGEVAAVSEHIASTSEELTATAEETNAITEESVSTLENLAQGALEQLNSVKSANSSIDIISENIKNSADRSEKVIESSKRVLQVTYDGRKQSDNAMSKINEIEEITKQTSTVIEKLDDESERIGKIVAVIKDIADQTNLLSLNAAIEAARAGEQGKGFAVVAEEVKGLAEQCSNSAQEIENLISNIQIETKKAVQIAAQGSIKVEDGVKAVNIAGESFTIILNEINNVDAQVKQVYDLAEKALKESEGVVDAMNNVNIIAEKSASDTEEVLSGAKEQAASMETVVKSSETLSGMGNTLQELISRFNL
ncbi:MAG: methyl-accepting chemotaxis protein [Romboutsia sp.]|nr:methyl-accepting chemotaxis protein [Romboutsia sp.]